MNSNIPPTRKMPVSFWKEDRPRCIPILLRSKRRASYWDLPGPWARRRSRPRFFFRSRPSTCEPADGEPQPTAAPQTVTGDKQGSLAE